MDTTWVYILTEPQLWTVGFYGPGGNWNGDSDHRTPEDAAKRVHYLNGGIDISNMVTKDSFLSFLNIFQQSQDNFNLFLKLQDQLLKPKP